LFVQVRLLDGPVTTVLAAGAPAQAVGGGRRAHLVLAALALGSGPVPADRLADLVWAEPPPTWRVALRGVVAGLRAAAGGELVETTPLGYRLAPGVTTDVADLEPAVADAVRLLAQGRHQAAADLAAPVAAAAGDRLLPGVEADWLRPHRDRVDALSVRAGELVAEAAGLAGDHGRAIATARSLVAAHPLDERAHRALIAALDRGGDRAGAVAAYEACRDLLAEHMGVDPTAETVATYLRALRDQVTGSEARVPRHDSSFVAREADLADVVALMGAPGLVTITGAGGVGKSRLAAEAATAVRAFDGGRWWVSLATVLDNALVAPALALRLGFSTGADDAAARTAARLAGLGRCLLVVDGCDGVEDGTASLVTTLLAGCPGLTVVVTSRGPLGVDGEQVVRLGPLGVDEASTRLLADRVREGGGELELTPELAPYVATLCRRCAGLPLALELVAAQLAELSPGDLVDHIDEVAGEGEDALRRIVEGSYALLDADEAAVFRRFSVLDGGCALDVVKAVVADDVVRPVRVVRIVRELSVRGLLVVDRSRPHWRYRMDDDLRRTAARRLDEEGETAATFARLRDFVRGLLPDDPRAAPASYADDVTAVVDSLRSLLGAGLGLVDRDGALEIAFRLHRYWAATSVAEGRFWLGRLLAAGGTTSWSPYAEYALGYLSYWAGDNRAAAVELQSAADALTGVDDAYVARALIYLGGLLDDEDRGPEAVSVVRRAIAAAEPYGADLRVAAAMGLGSVAAERGDIEASEHAARAIELCETGASGEQLAATLPTAAMVCWQVGDLDRCRDFVERGAPLLAGTRRIAHVVLLTSAAGLALAEGDAGAAVRAAEEGDDEATDLGVERELPLVRSLLALALLDRGEPDSAAAAAAAAVRAATGLGYDFPLAGALEAAAEVGLARGTAPDQLAVLTATAAEIRARGDRPVPAPLAARTVAVADRIPVAAPVPPQEAAALAVALLDPPETGTTTRTTGAVSPRSG
jgi:predicted ATPase/DNA-binding SARP family transcriptional activator